MTFVFCSYFILSNQSIKDMIELGFEEQTIIDKIDAKLKVSKMQKWAYDKHIQLKRFLQTYMSIVQITQ